MIELKNVTKKYGAYTGLYWESVTFRRGEVVGVLGENGSGKTTLLKAIMGLGDLDNGEIWVDGRPVTEQYERMAFITEEGSYMPQMTPYSYAHFLADYFPGFQMERYKLLLRFFGLQTDAKIKSFSKGQKAKLEVCVGFSKNASYILMDEPFLGKDLFTRRDFLKLMISSLKSDETILISTHLIDEIENVIDRAIILQNGRIKGDFMLDELREEGKDLATVMAEIMRYNENRAMQLFK